MSWDDAARPRLGLIDEPDAQRLARVMDAVMADLPAQALPARRLNWTFGRWLAGLAPAAPRFAMPMATAAILGVVVGRYLQVAEDAVLVTDLLTYTSWLSTGF